MRTTKKHATTLRQTETKPWATRPAHITERKIDHHEDQFY